MRKYNTNLTITIALIVIMSFAIGVIFVSEDYFLCSIPGVFLIVCIYRLILFLKRTIKDMQRLNGAIRFSEFNISFEGYEGKGLIPSLALDLEKSITHFNDRLQKKEAEISFYDILLNRIDSAIIAVSSDKKILWINKASLDLFGKPRPKELSDLHAVSAELPAILDKLNPGEIKTLKINTDYKEYNLAITVVLINLKGEDIKLISLKNIQIALDENESKSWISLIRVLTHEMMNSLTPIISLSETFSESKGFKNDDIMIYQAMQVIYRRSKGLVEFIHNYQKLTYLSKPNKSLFNAKEVVNDISHLLRAEDIYISFLVEPDNILLFADRIQIEQVLINLIKNAWDACIDVETPKVIVKITKNEYQQPIISISDNGTGISPDVIDKIFIPFFSTKKNGSGIGLSICRQTIILHGGSISVLSEPNKGTCFMIKL